MNSAKYTTDGGSWTIERTDVDTYAVISEGGRFGFVERVGNVYVALRGSRYDRCVEIGQTLEFDAAASLLAS